jgi:hypothetical protein
MHYLLCKHRVADFGRWLRVFQGDAGAQRAAGMQLLHVLRDDADPNLIVLLFRTDDPVRARAFTEAPQASESARDSGVIGAPEVLFLSD